jgi:hypothetical protein
MPKRPLSTESGFFMQNILHNMTTMYLLRKVVRTPDLQFPGMGYAQEIMGDFVKKFYLFPSNMLFFTRCPYKSKIICMFA